MAILSRLVALSTAITSVQSRGTSGAFVSSRPFVSPAFAVHSIRGGDGGVSGSNSDDNGVGNNANHTSITAVEVQNDADVDMDVDVELDVDLDIDEDMAPFESEVGYDDGTSDIDIHETINVEDDVEDDEEGANDNNNDDNEIVNDATGVDATIDVDTDSSHHVFHEISLTQEEEDAIQAQEEAFPDVPTASDGEGLYSTVSDVDVDVDVEESHGKTVEIETAPNVEESSVTEEEEETEEEITSQRNDNNDEEISVPSSAEEDDPDAIAAKEEDGENEALEEVEAQAESQVDEDLQMMMMETSDGGDLDADFAVEMEMDYPSGSDSAAFVDRMDLADAYDTEVDTEIDNDIYNVVEEEDEESIEIIEDVKLEGEEESKEESPSEGLSHEEAVEENIEPEPVETEQIENLTTTNEEKEEPMPIQEEEQDESAEKLEIPAVGSTSAVTASPVPPPAQGPTVKYIITENMRRVLIRKLGYKSWEVANMKPDVATVVVDKMLKRPINGMPEEFYIDYDAAVSNRKNDSDQKLWTFLTSNKERLQRIVVPAIASGLTIALATSALSGSSDGESSSDEGQISIDNGSRQIKDDKSALMQEPSVNQPGTTTFQSKKKPIHGRNSAKNKSSRAVSKENTNNSEDLETEELMTKLVEDAGSEDVMDDSNIIDKVINFILEKIDEIFKRPF